MKRRIKLIVQKFPFLWNIYFSIKMEYKRLIRLLYYIHDVRRVYRYMFWSGKDISLERLRAELLFQYHKIEKGLVMPGVPRLFGVEPVLATMSLINQWRKVGYSLQDPIFCGALEALHSYQEKIATYSLDDTGKILPVLQDFLISYPERKEALLTPQALVEVNSFDGLKQLALARRSVRSFQPEHVDFQLIKNAIDVAQLSPSACNRQPCKVYLIRDAEKKKAILSLQNGNRGFGHLVPDLVIVTASLKTFFDASERNEPYIDAGLFTMSFLYGLASQGIGSCCLNWCVQPNNDKTLHDLLGIDEFEKVIMLIAVGYADVQTVVPRSARREISSVLVEL